MADETFRSYRQRDPRLGERAPAGSAAGGRPGGTDPLAELARLIGQTDPFSEANRNAAARPAPRAPQQPTHPGSHQPRAAEPAAPYAANPYGAPVSPRRAEPAPFDTQAPMDPAAGFEPAYDPAIYGSAPQAPGYGSQVYYDDPSAMPQDEEGYQDEFYDKPPRRGMKTIMLVGALALIGIGGAFGYRALFGGENSGPPPVIKADSSPSKVAPPTKNEASNKLIYDRVGDVNQGEKVVSREEQPMDVNAGAKSPAGAFPGVVNSSDSSGPASAPLGSMPAGPSIAEPKKIRTVAIKPDQPLSEAAAPAASVMSSTAPRNIEMATASPVPATAPRSLAPSAPAPERAAPTPSNAPLSLAPQSLNAPAPPPVAAPAPARPAAPTRLASTNPVDSGGYAVQISSQRSEAEAQASFRSLQAKYPSVLGGQQPIIRRADLGTKGIYYRTMVGPFASADQATEFCRNLKAAGGQCVVQRN